MVSGDGDGEGGGLGLGLEQQPPPGATAAPGKTSCTAWRRLAKAGWSTLETGDGSVACITSTLTRGSLMTRTSRAL